MQVVCRAKNARTRLCTGAGMPVALRKRQVFYRRPMVSMIVTALIIKSIITIYY
nr:hypothetical protein SHINE37_41943 [Rhizobiaceae bacterium]